MSNDTIRGLCDCANEPAMRRLRDVMRLMRDWAQNEEPHGVYYPKYCARREALAPHPLWELLMHWLTAVDWAEHGGGINTSWLTGEGERTLAELEAMDLGEDDPTPTITTNETP